MYEAFVLKKQFIITPSDLDAKSFPSTSIANVCMDKTKNT